VPLAAYAKVNLHLRILDARPDGYHYVVTVLQTLALHDTVMCERHDGPFEIVCDEPGVPLDSRNLVWRAAQALADAVSRPEGLARTRVTIVKRIPMQAGLGGGSADAAAALAGLMRLWEIGMDHVSLHRIASGLGADVPFLLHALLQFRQGRADGGTMLGRGRGDELTALPPLPLHTVLIVMPPFGVSTADAYRWHDERVAAAAAPPDPDTAEVAATRADSGGAEAEWPGSSAEWSDCLTRCYNDFELAIGPRHSEIAETVRTLREAGAVFAAMSGSGAALFGLFPAGERGEQAAGLAAGRFTRPGWRTYLTGTTGTLHPQQ
jgi:4-diphosphocytidyl-2-C-methyl-D-erythritol kinase